MTHELRERIAEACWIERRKVCSAYFWDMSWQDLLKHPDSEIEASLCKACYLLAGQILALIKSAGWVKLADGQAHEQAVLRRVFEEIECCWAWDTAYADGIMPVRIADWEALKQKYLGKEANNWEALKQKYMGKEANSGS